MLRRHRGQVPLPSFLSSGRGLATLEESEGGLEAVIQGGKAGKRLGRVAIVGGWTPWRRNAKGLVSACCLPCAHQESTGKPNTS